MSHEVKGRKSVLEDLVDAGKVRCSSKISFQNAFLH